MPEKQLSEALARRSGRNAACDHRDMLMNATVGILSFTPDNRVDYANWALARMFGYASPEHLIAASKDVTALFFADPQDKEHLLGRLARNEERLAYQCRFVRRDGSFFWASCHLRAVRDEKGKIVYYQGCIEDITEHKLERESLLRTQFAMNKAPDSILWVDDTGAIVYANESACASMGYTREELQAMTVFDIDPDFPPDNWEAHKAQVRRSGAMTFESRHRAKDGRFFPVEVRTNHFKYNDRYLACAFDRDISERKQAETALKESETRFRMLFNDAPLPMAHVSLDGAILDVNDCLRQTLGYSADDVRSLEDAWAHCLPDQDLRRQITSSWRTQIQRAVAEKAAINPIECPLRCKDGTVRTMVIGTKLIGDSLIFSFFDITDRKQAEQEREQLQGQLLQSQKLEAVGILAGGVAHDFNNMLGAIMGYAEVTLNQMDPADPFRHNLDKILDAARRSANLARQLLAFARKQTIAPIVFDLNEAVEAILKMIGRLIGENIALDWLPGPQPCPIQMDTSQLDQILVNLCVNARDAIADVGRICIETRTVSIGKAGAASHFYFVPGDYVLLAVSDDGCGMDKQTLDHIFEPFFTTKGLGRGTGLGLATVYGIVKQNKGFINAYSEPGKGTTFKIYLPFKAVDAIAPTASAVEDVPRGQGETLLLVEDDPILLEMSTVMLEQLGYTVLFANSPQAAIRIAEQTGATIDLLITDVIMPEMNGRDLADRLQQLCPKIKRLFMSGYTANVIAHQGVLEEGLHFLQKPFVVKELAVKVRLALG